MYDELFGGVGAVRAGIFEQVNGFSNSFYGKFLFWREIFGSFPRLMIWLCFLFSLPGWGGEDDDFSQNRLLPSGFQISRFDSEVSRYTALEHEQADKDGSSYEKFRDASDGKSMDGLDSLEYQVLSSERKALYRHLVVDVW